MYVCRSLGRDTESQRRVEGHYVDHQTSTYLSHAKHVIYTNIGAMGNQGHLRIKHFLSDHIRELGDADVVSVGLLD
jgi:hypothetical protein